MHIARLSAIARTPRAKSGGAPVKTHSAWAPTPIPGRNGASKLRAWQKMRDMQQIFTGVRTFFRAFYAAYPSRRRLPSIVSHTVPPSSLKYLILSVLYRLSHPSSSSMNSAWETPRQSRP